MYYRYLATPIGELLLAGDGDALCVVGFPDGSRRRGPEPGWIWSERPFTAACEQLEAYFEGALRRFDLPLKPGGTAFQLAVLAELQKIPYGTTVSYGDIAQRIGRPRAVRAVGAANGRNPIPIIIPCHRVIGASGDLTGFGGGLAVKEALLRLEMEHSQFPHVPL
ncbi:MAG TPA: methylated-DNA--[protein]-cysteine S-methyltransferase [Woeseiaceae bacterium]|nr:methylated-DNA--[protein]-cysteine S-methyltransferase [Woeseiaceae bacterium]